MAESPSPEDELRFDAVWPGMAPCRRCGAPMRQDVEVCPHCGKWQNGVGLIVAGLAAILISLATAWIVFHTY